MASYEYRVETRETIDGQHEWWDVTAVPSGGWTHASAIAYCRETWPRLVGMSDRVRVMRRRGPRSKWMAHRAYRCDASGIVRRTDRASK